MGSNFSANFGIFRRGAHESEEGKLHPTAPRSEAILLSLSRHASRLQTTSKFGCNQLNRIALLVAIPMAGSVYCEWEAD